MTFKTLLALGVLMLPLALSAQDAPIRLEAVPAAGNAARIDAVNKASVTGKKAPKDKIRGGYVYTFWGVTPNSILEDENIAISFVKDAVRNYFFANRNVGHGYFPRIENKSDKTVYVDLAASFYVDCNGVSHPFFTNSAYTTSQSGSTGGAVNLGAITGALGVGGTLGSLASGISVGGSSGNGTSVTTQEQQIVVIPSHSASQFPISKSVINTEVVELPLSLVYLVDRPYDVWMGDGGFEKHYKELYGSLADFNKSVIPAEELGVKENSFVRFTPEESPKIIKIIFTYSTNPNFSEYYQVETDIYLKNIYGAGNLSAFLHDHQKPIEAKDFVPDDENAPLLWGYGWLPKEAKKGKKEAKGASMND